MDKKTSPKPPPARPEPKIDITEIAHYRDGQIIEIAPNDLRTYCVKSGAVQRVVTLPGSQGLGPLKLGTIRGKFEGVYWQPSSAFGFARRNGIHVEFIAIGQTLIQKLTNNDLYKDGNRLVTALASALIVQNELVADTELVIKREFERAEREASDARSARTQLETANEELESLREKAIEDEADKSHLNRLLRQATNEKNAALNREKVLLQEKRDLKQKLASEKTKGLGVMQRLIHEMEDLRVQFTDLSHWVESQSDLPEVQAGQKAVGPVSMDEDLDAIFDAFLPMDKERGGMPSIPPIEVRDDELIPFSPQQGMTFQDHEAYSAGSRNTLPFIPTSLGPPASGLENDVWGSDPPTHVQKRTDNGLSRKS